MAVVLHGDQGRLPAALRTIEKAGIAGVRRRPGVSGGRRGPVEGGSRAALPRARAAQHPRRPDEQAQERGRQGAAQTRTQAHQNQHCGRGRQLARRTQCMARRTRRLPQGKDHGQTGSRARQGAQVVVDARTSAPRLLPARPAQPRRDAVRVLRPRHRGGTENRCRRPRTSWKAGPTRLSSARSTTTGGCRKSI